MEITKADLLRQFDTPVRFLFEREDKALLRLFWFNYDRVKDEFYMGSSLNPIISAGKEDVHNVIFTDEGTLGIEIDNTIERKKFNSLKFSFHSSGVRHLRMIDPLLSTKEKPHYEELYREKYSKLEAIKSSEMLFTILSKRISLYDDYKKKVNKDRTSAILLKTPANYLKYRQIFEFYICNAAKGILPNFIIKKETPFEDLTFKLKDNLFLYVKFVINVAKNSLNSNYPDKEILFFRDKNILKTFSFE